MTIVIRSKRRLIPGRRITIGILSTAAIVVAGILEGTSTRPAWASTLLLVGSLAVGYLIGRRSQ